MCVHTVEMMIALSMQHWRSNIRLFYRFAQTVSRVAKSNHQMWIQRWGCTSTSTSKMQVYCSSTSCSEKTSWLSNDQCELISIHLFVLLLESFFVPFVIDFASKFLHVCMHSLSPLTFVFFCVTSAHCNGTPNVTKISWECIMFQGSISGTISRTFQRSIPGTISRTFSDFVALFPGRSCLQCLITGSMQKTEEEDLGDRVTCVTSGRREGDRRCPIVITYKLCADQPRVYRKSCTEAVFRALQSQVLRQGIT